MNTEFTDLPVADASNAAVGASHLGASADQAARILAVIPTLGRRLDTLDRALDSIAGQTGVAVDILLVGKQASPELTLLAQRYGAGLLLNPGHISAAVNAGFAQATAAHRFLLWLGDDDLLRPDALAVASGLLDGDPGAVVCYGDCDYIDIGGQLLFTRSPPAWSPFLLQFVPGLIKQETCLFRREALIESGGLDEDLQYTMDLDLLLKLRRLGHFVKAPRVQAAFCWHPGSLTISNRRVSLQEAQAVQSRHARGLVKLLYPVWKQLIWWLIMGLSSRINRSMGRS